MFEGLSDVETLVADIHEADALGICSDQAGQGRSERRQVRRHRAV